MSDYMTDSFIAVQRFIHAHETGYIFSLTEVWDWFRANKIPTLSEPTLRKHFDKHCERILIGRLAGKRALWRIR